MPRTNTQTKPRKAVPKAAATETEEHLEVFPKIKKAVEIDEPEAVLGVEEKEEKLDEDGMPITEEEDELGTDEAGIDDEEVNPFGDKWEE
jgi:hypothetical protein